MKKILYFSVIFFALFACNGSKGAKNNRNEDSSSNQESYIQEVKQQDNAEQENVEKILNGSGLSLNDLTFVGSWTFTLGSGAYTFTDKLSLFKHNNSGNYYILDQFSDGSNIINTAMIAKKGGAYELDPNDNKFEKYIIEGNVIRMIDKQFPDEKPIVAKGVFYEDKL